jgi:hypothetical protein
MTRGPNNEHTKDDNSEFEWINNNINILSNYDNNNIL